MSIREINEVRLYGNLVMAPKFDDKTESSQARTFFRMAVNHESRNIEKPWYFDVVCWDRLAKAVARWCDKGKEVYVEGQLESRSVQVDGHSVLVCHIRASKVKFGDDSKKNQAEPQSLSTREMPRTTEEKEIVWSEPHASETPPEEKNLSGLEEVARNINPEDLLEVLASLTKHKLEEDSRNKF